MLDAALLSIALSHAADLGTTEYVLHKNHSAFEGNPLMKNIYVRDPLVVGLTTVEMIGVSKLRKSHPRGAKILWIGSSLLHFGVAVHNLRQK